VAWKWRGTFRAIHRDIGYVVVALTLAYGLSGLAVNHLDDWNPNYTYSERAIDLGPFAAGTPPEHEAVVIAKLALERRTVRGHFQESASAFRVFLDDGQEVVVDLRTGRGTYKKISTRAVFFEVNALHLNNLKGLWTWVADLFAISMIVLALTGASMMKGKDGFLGRGKYFVGAGLCVPIAAVVYMYMV